MLEIKNLDIELKTFKLIARDIQLFDGDKIVLFAQNNFGKSMFLLGLTGLIRTKKREIFFNKVNCNEDKWQNHTGVYHDQSSLVPFLTPVEFFRMIGSLKGIPSEFVTRDVIKYCEYFNFSKDEKKYISELSLGTQKKVGIIGSLLGSPDTILWDEPFTNLDDASTAALSSIIVNELTNTLVLLTSPTEELTYKPFNSRLTIENGCVLKN